LRLQFVDAFPADAEGVHMAAGISPAFLAVVLLGELAVKPKG
jgi:hypothetical protein